MASRPLDLPDQGSKPVSNAGVAGRVGKPSSRKANVSKADELEAALHRFARMIQQENAGKKITLLKPDKKIDKPLSLR